MYGGKDEGVYMDSTYNLFYPKGSFNLKASGRGTGWKGGENSTASNIALRLKFKRAFQILQMHRNISCTIFLIFG
jgi:hypothetical protein